jgi:hypothetical protein
LIARRGKLSTNEFRAIFEQVLEGLKNAHEHDIIHRDLKPGNIMLVKHDGATVAKIVDFGLAAHISNELAAQKLTKSGVIMGTPLYMSPEQCRGEKLDARSDIYALGCVMYEAVCGKPPFEGDNALALMMMHSDEEAIFPKDLERFTSDFVRKCMQKQAEHRYRTAAEALTDLRSAHVAVKSKAKLRLPAAPSAVAALCTILIVLALGTSVMVRQQSSAGKQNRQAALDELDQQLGKAATHRILEGYRSIALSEEVRDSDRLRACRQLAIYSDEPEEALKWFARAKHFAKALQKNDWQSEFFQRYTHRVVQRYEQHHDRNAALQDLALLARLEPGAAAEAARDLSYHMLPVGSEDALATLSKGFEWAKQSGDRARIAESVRLIARGCWQPTPDPGKLATGRLALESAIAQPSLLVRDRAELYYELGKNCFGETPEQNAEYLRKSLELLGPTPRPLTCAVQSMYAVNLEARNLPAEETFKASVQPAVLKAAQRGHPEYAAMACRNYADHLFTHGQKELAFSYVNKGLAFVAEPKTSNARQQYGSLNYVLGFMYFQNGDFVSSRPYLEIACQNLRPEDGERMLAAELLKKLKHGASP